MPLDRNRRPYNLRNKRFPYRGGRVSGIRLRYDTCSSEVRSNEWPQKCIIFVNKDNGGAKATTKTKNQDDGDGEAKPPAAWPPPWDTARPVAVILNPANEDDYPRSCASISRANEAIIEPRRPPPSPSSSRPPRDAQSRKFTTPRLFAISTLPPVITATRREAYR